MKKIFLATATFYLALSAKADFGRNCKTAFPSPEITTSAQTFKGTFGIPAGGFAGYETYEFEVSESGELRIKKVGSRKWISVEAFPPKSKIFSADPEFEKVWGKIINPTLTEEVRVTQLGYYTIPVGGFRGVSKTAFRILENGTIQVKQDDRWMDIQSFPPNSTLFNLDGSMIQPTATTDPDVSEEGTVAIYVGGFAGTLKYPYQVTKSGEIRITKGDEIIVSRAFPKGATVRRNGTTIFVDPTLPTNPTNGNEPNQQTVRKPSKPDGIIKQGKVTFTRGIGGRVTYEFRQWKDGRIEVVDQFSGKWKEVNSFPPNATFDLEE